MFYKVRNITLKAVAIINILMDSSVETFNNVHSPLSLHEVTFLYDSRVVSALKVVIQDGSHWFDLTFQQIKCSVVTRGSSSHLQKVMRSKTHLNRHRSYLLL